MCGKEIVQKNADFLSLGCKRKMGVFSCVEQLLREQNWRRTFEYVEQIVSALSRAWCNAFQMSLQRDDYISKVIFSFLV